MLYINNLPFSIHCCAKHIYVEVSSRCVCHLTIYSTIILFPSRGYLKGNHVFVHINLCTALLFGNLVFVSGIDTANDNRVSYVVVTQKCITLSMVTKDSYICNT